MAEVHIDNVSKRFGDFIAVDNIDIRFSSGEVTCLLGPSGCGKTTLMRMIAGLESVTTGRIHMDGRDVTDLQTRDRNIGMVFQYPVMYHPLSVRENIAEPFRRDKSISKEARSKRVDEMLDLLDMRDQADAYIDQLNSGMRQKVAVGRAVARQTAVVLFDEPTTNVEINAKLQLIRAFKEITRRLKQTIIYVTHDQTEAMTLADHIALMKDGEIVQYAPPRELYGNPTTTFGGWFLGNPGMNFVPATVADGKVSASLLAQPLKLTQDVPSTGLSIGVRPEHMEVAASPGAETVSGELLESTFGIAGQRLLRVKIDRSIVSVKSAHEAPVKQGEQIHLKVPRAVVALFAEGQRIAV